MKWSPLIRFSFVAFGFVFLTGMQAPAIGAGEVLIGGCVLVAQRLLEDPEDKRRQEARRKRQAAEWPATAKAKNEAEHAALLARAKAGDVQAQLRMWQRAKSASEEWMWICRAAHGGHPNALFQVALYYDLPKKPIRRDSVSAYKWYTLALGIGHASANGNRSELAKRMNPAQIAKAERLAARWEPNPKECEAAGAMAASLRK